MSGLDKPNIIGINFVKHCVKLKLKDQYIQKWRSDVNMSEKCCLYKYFKLEYGLENYLSTLPNKLRIAITKFRISNTKLPIEQGRYNNVPRHHRFCKLCNINVVGDEYHLLLECPFLSETRKLYLPRYYIQHINMIKFNMIMTSTSRPLMLKLSKFLACTLPMLK